MERKFRFSFMADELVKISELSESTSTADTDLIAIVKGGSTFKMLKSNLVAGLATVASLLAHTSNTSNPHSTTKSQVGLGNVDNTSDANKPVSTATQTALDGKVDKNSSITGATKTKITYDAKGLVTAGADATQDDIGDGTTNKQYSATDKTKLAGIEAAADVTDAGNVGSAVHGASAKTTPVDADSFALTDSAASNVLKKVTWANIKATAKAYFDTLYAAVTHTHAQSDITNLTSDLAGKQASDTELTAIAGLTSAANKIPRFTGSGTADLIDFKDEDDMSSNSATAVPSQQSVKAYVDNAVVGGGGYTDEQAQDAVGAMVADTATIDLTYTDATPELKADVKDDSITYAKIQNVSATNRILGRITTGAGDIEELTAANVRTIINVADGATANSSDATLLARANHTGTQTASTISDFTEASQDVIGALLADSSTIDYTYNDAGNAETVSVIDNSSTQKVIVAKAGTNTGTRQKINFIEGTNVTITTSDNSGSDRVDVTIAASGGGGSSDPYAYISRAYESLDGQSFQNPTGSGAKTIDRTSDDGLSVRTGSTNNSTVLIHWADEQATPRADLMPLNIYGSWHIAVSGLAASSAATAYFKWFSASNDDTIMTTDQIGLDLSKVSGAVAPKTSTGDGTTQQTTSISGGTYTSGFRNRYSFKWDGTSVSFYLNGVLKNTHSTNVPRRTSSIEWGYNSCIYAKNTTADAYTIVLSAFNLAWPILG